MNEPPGFKMRRQYTVCFIEYSSVFEDFILWADGQLLIVFLSTICAIYMWSRRIMLPLHYNKKSYAALQIFFFATLLKNFVSVFSFHMDVYKVRNIGHERFFLSCKVYEILYNFFNFFELEALTYCYINRYVNIKYTIHGWPLEDFSYSMYWIFSLGFALFYTCLPIYGFGSYAYDYNSLFCSLTLVDIERFHGVSYFLKTIKPVSLIYFVKMVVTIATAEYSTAQLCRRANIPRKLLEDSFFTLVMKIVLTVNFVCWTAGFLLRGHTVLYPHTGISPDTVDYDTNFIIYWIWITSQLAPIATAPLLCVGEWRTRIKRRKIHNCDPFPNIFTPAAL